MAPGDELVLFDSAVDKTDVYVQAQLILTVTLQQAINLDNRTITELDIPDIYVEPLEQKSFQRRIAGKALAGNRASLRAISTKIWGL